MVLPRSNPGPVFYEGARMTPLITILVITFNEGTITLPPYPDEMACSAMLGPVHDLLLDEYPDAHGGYVMSQCIRTGAPSAVTVRPVARP
jgi:hypothetical protein